MMQQCLSRECTKRKKGIEIKIRTSENYHEFQEKLFQNLKAYSLQGLLLNSRNEFTAAVEAVEYENGDDLTKVPFSEEQLNARYILAHAIGIPLYLLLYVQGIYKILEVEKRQGKIEFIFKENQLTEKELIEWWKERKQTVQNKALNNGGEKRIERTVFDRTLRKYGCEWGGNIDGFVLNDSKTEVRYIIDNISVSAPNLNDEPSHYFNSANPKHGPRYEGWYAAVKLANTLHVPHVLFTIDKNKKQEEHVGFAIIRKLTPEGIWYVDNVSPNRHILSGLEWIKREVEETVSRAKPPEIVEKVQYGTR